MSDLEHFAIVEDRAEFRPVGSFSLQQATALITSAIMLSRIKKVRKILIVTNGLIGFPPPKLHERYAFVNEWSRFAGDNLSLAVVARTEMIDPQKFGVTVAKNAGVTSDIFESEEAALAWLQKIV